jgi:RNA polymerase sigma factor (sigma-70 family)
MGNTDRSSVTRYLHRLFGLPRGHDSSDAQLLERFVAEQDEAAFERLVWRHGPTVLGVCRRVLRHEQDAEDAFQATFLVLVRKAGSIGKRQAVGSWLYRVALRVALRARAGKRAAPRAEVVDVPVEPAPGPDRDDLRPVLDEEVNRLPEKYRAPFVLCYLEGRTNEEAARQLGCPRGTVQSRLAWARQRLRDRLGRRGLALSEVTPAIVSPQLVRSTLSSALGGAPAQVAALGKGVLQTMLWTRLKLVAACVFLSGALGIGGALSMPKPGGPGLANADQPPPNAASPRPPEETFVFELRDKPWPAVLEWYSEISGLAYVGRYRPRGKATFIPPTRKRKYSLGEITDVLNELLMAQNHILVRRTTTFTLLPADEKLDGSLLPEVRPEDLPRRGKTELVATVLLLKATSVADVAPLVKKMMGPFGGVVLVPRTNRLILQDTAGNLRRIHRTLEELDGAKPPAASLGQRLAEVEKQLQRLREEVKLLRQEVKEKGRRTR